MTVLVTGGAGFIGSTLVHALSKQGRPVRVLDDLSTGREANLEGSSAELVVGDVADARTVERCLSGVTAVVHLAAHGSVPRSIADPLGSNAANVSGTLTVLEAARQSGLHVVFSSSSAVFGSNRELPKRERLWTQPVSPYGASKLAAESYCLAYREVYGIDVLVLRFFNVYGPRQRPDHDYAAVVPRFAWAAIRGEPLVIHGDGEQMRDFTHVDSVVRIVEDALDRRVSHDVPVNLAFGDRVTVNGIAGEIGRQLGQILDIRYAPSRRGDVRDSRNDPALLRSVFPDTAVPIAFQRGVASVLEWMRSQG